MKKKISIIFGIVFILLIISLSAPISGVTIDNENIFDRTRIRAIGSFHYCEEDEAIYGRVFIGFFGLKPVILKKIVIDMDDIVWVVMTNHILRCVTR